METTEFSTSIIIKEEPLSPIAFCKSSVEADVVKSEGVEEDYDVSASCQIIDPNSREDIKTEELNIYTSGDEEKDHYEWPEPNALALKEESFLGQRPITEDRKCSVLLAVPQTHLNEDLQQPIYIRTSEDDDHFIEIRHQNQTNVKVLLKELFAKSFVQLGKRIDHLQNNLKINQQTETVGLNNACTKILTKESQCGKRSISKKSEVNQRSNKIDAKSPFLRAIGEHCSKSHKNVPHHKHHLREATIDSRKKKRVKIQSIASSDKRQNILDLTQSINNNTQENKITKSAEILNSNKCTFSCDHCSKMFFRKSDLKRHVMIHTGEKLYNCEICTKSFSLKYYLNRHVKTHTVKKPYPCEQCTKSFFNKSYFIQHLSLHAGEKPYPCKQCTKSFSQRSSLKRHIRIHTGEKPYSCEQCAKHFSERSNLIRHLRTHSGEQPYSCQQCTKSFIRKSSLIQHLRTHTSEKRYSCKQCTKYFSHKSYLIKHFRTHKGHKPYSCEICTKSYTDRSNLMRHLRTHTSDKPYACKQCAKSFFYRSDFNQHIKTHTGDKPYPCKQCTKYFSHKSYLIKHLRTHKDDKPYSCEQCTKSYTDRSSLIRHIRTHTGEKQYSCKQCAKSFFYRSDLIRHVRIHTGEKP